MGTEKWVRIERRELSHSRSSVAKGKRYWSEDSKEVKV